MLYILEASFLLALAPVYKTHSTEEAVPLDPLLFPELGKFIFLIS